MSDRYTTRDEERLEGAKGALHEAYLMVSDAWERGQCPRFTSLVQDAVKLAEGAAVMLKRVSTKI